MPEAAKTSVSNLDSRLQGISEADLPLSFREAFAFAMFLDVSYVWIDSLCIIQDSAEDLQQEIAQMSKVYSCSYCTLATSNRNATHPRFFSADVLQILRSRDRQSNLQMKCRIPPHARMQVESHLIFGQATLSLNDIANQPSQLRRRLNWLDALNSIPLNRRGWTLQERELSPRVFHYTPMTALWECRSLRALEEDPCGFSDHGSLWHGILGELTTVSRYRLLDNYHTKRKPMPFGLSLMIKFSGKCDEIYNSWLRVVEDYSERRLTFASDKFAAISGLAQEVQRLTESDYIAGLWRGDLSRGLLWRKFSPSIQDLEEYRPKPAISARHYPENMSSHWSPICLAPSWSWASANYPLSYDLVQMHLAGADRKDHRLPKFLDIFFADFGFSS